jgi:hypothetical protein
VEALLYTRQQGHQRYPLETAEPALTWLAAALDGCSKQDKGSAKAVAGVTLVVRKFARLLCYGVATMQRSWDCLLAPEPAGRPRVQQGAGLRCGDVFSRLFEIFAGTHAAVCDDALGARSRRCAGCSCADAALVGPHC